MRGTTQFLDAFNKINRQIQAVRSASSIYAGLQTYADNTELKNLWQKLAVQKKYHAVALERLRDTLSREALEIETFFINPEKIDLLSGELDAIAHEIHSGISCSRAFEIALFLESSELNALFVNSNNEGNKNPSLYIHSMGDGIKSHLTLIYKGMKKFVNTQEQAPHLQKLYELGIISREELTP